jgi:D-lactate dehydrogenase
MKMAVFSAQPYDVRFLDEARAADTSLVYHTESLSLQSVALAQGCGAVCVFVNDVLDAAVLDALAGLGVRAILMRCAGFNNLDISAARRRGLFVARIPSYSPESVAEHTLALILTLNRHTHRAYARVREGNFALDGLLGSTLHGKTVGLVGMGKIGQAAARIFHGFGCRVLGYDPVAPAAEATMVALPELLADADIVSLHCPLAPPRRSCGASSAPCWSIPRAAPWSTPGRRSPPSSRASWARWRSTSTSRRASCFSRTARPPSSPTMCSSA